MIRAALYDIGRKTVELGDEQLFDRYSADGNHWLWLDFDNHDPAQERQFLETRLAINPLAVTDAQRSRHPPKFEAFEDHLFLLLRGLSAESNSLDYETIQISCFIGRNILVTRHFDTSLSINRAWTAMEKGKLDLERGHAYIAFRIARNLVDRYTPILLALEDRLEELEDEMFKHPSDKLLAELVSYNGKLKKLRRTLVYQRNLFATLLSGETSLLDQKHQHEFNDVYEQFERLSSLASLFQELVVDLMNGYLSLSAHRLNQIMKVLTIATVVFLPLTVLAGIYGMNFEFMPELKWHYGYFTVLGVMAGLIVGSLFVLRKLRWL